MASPSTRYQCKRCGICFRTEGMRRDHMRIHSEKTIECLEPGCSKMFATQEHLRKHLRITHNDLKLKCKVCEKEYGSSSALKRHERCHGEEKRYICEECGAGFDISEPYKIHIRVHEGLRPFICSRCGKAFSSRGICRRHVRETHEQTEKESNGQISKQAE